MALFDLFRPARSPRPEEPHRRLYAAVVAQARQADFYLRCGVPDTPDGRFDMIALHAVLVLRRLKREHEQTADLAQAFFDLMFADMDQNLRELGVGDLSVGKRVKAMAEALYGRIRAYEEGLTAVDDEVLIAALGRNLYRKAPPRPAQASAVAAYMRREAAALDIQAAGRLLAGEVRFGPAPTLESVETEAR